MVTVFTKRIVAYVLDFIVVSAIMWIISYILSLIVQPVNLYDYYRYLPYAVPILIMVYFVVCEKLFSATIGKSLMYLEVKSNNGANISWLQAFIRNLTKIYWFPIIFDWLLGKFLRTDRIFNNIAKTVVIHDS